VLDLHKVVLFVQRKDKFQQKECSNNKIVLSRCRQAKSFEAFAFRGKAGNLERP
jgi:hypothetical protein